MFLLAAYRPIWVLKALNVEGLADTISNMFLRGLVPLLRAIILILVYRQGVLMSLPSTAAQAEELSEESHVRQLGNFTNYGVGKVCSAGSVFLQGA